ncbi:MAG: exodeoxyribonuclease III [bacterium]
MDLNKIRGLVKAGVTVSELSNQLGAEFHLATVSQLYQWWRSNRLVVERIWGGILDEPELVGYTDSACLLPDDRIQLQTQIAAETLKIATWNVNSIRIRLPLILSWLSEQQPDIVCLQETKVEDHQFPEQELREAGYNAVFSGQKSYNGVAILSRFPLKEVQHGFQDGWDSENKRLLMASHEGIHIVNVYVPQGQTEDSPKFEYKLQFLEKLLSELSSRFTAADPVIVLGDINIAPEARDVVSAEEMQNKVSFHPREHRFIEQFKQWGLQDAYRRFHQEGGRYSWWDFRTRGFERNEGMRIDHIWVTESLAGLCEACDIDFDNRSQPKPSDHAPVICMVKNDIR